MLCVYGCGNEGRYLIKFKSGDKWCCQKRWRKCPSLNSEITKKKISEKLKGIKRSLNTKKLMSEKAIQRYENDNERIKQSDRMKQIWQDENKRLLLAEKAKNRYSKPEYKKKHSLSLKKAYKRNEVLIKLKRSIEKIKIKYPTFFKEEDMRYNPIKPHKKEIQVRCKNHKCKNSKEYDGWFTPNTRQIELRIYCLENKNGNGGGYFYCSEECKSDCTLFNSRANDPFKMTLYEKYKNDVIKLTEKSVKKHFNKIKNINKRSRDFPFRS
ncbi:MAG: hypothetical protein K9L62_10300 [Vallitaleaceae bacterium]|nr:hypothetical protein [Vallitaleaceae bacterium]